MGSATSAGPSATPPSVTGWEGSAFLPLGSGVADAVPRLSLDSLREVFRERVVSAVDRAFFFELGAVPSHWALNPEINAYPFFKFDAGTPQDPVGTSRSPFRFAINSRMPEPDQLRAALRVVLETVRRQDIVNPTGTGPVVDDQLPTKIAALPEEILPDVLSIEARLAQGDYTGARSVLEQYGHPMHIAHVDLQYSLSDVAARVPFFAKAYNTNPDVKDAVDRVVSVTSSGRVRGHSDRARRLVEQAMLDARLFQYIAHAARDSLLFGVGLLWTRSAATMEMELVEPGDAVIRMDDDRLSSIKIISQDRVIDGGDVLRIPGDPDHHGAYGLSMLEAMTANLRIIDSLGNAAEVPTEVRDQIEQGSRASMLLGIAEGAVDEARGSIHNLLRPTLENIPRQRGPLYFAGHDRWP